MQDNNQTLPLNAHDIQLLKDNPSSDVRLQMLSKLFEQYKSQPLNISEQQIAFDIFRIALSDSDLAVRRCVSDNLKEAHFVPLDIVQKIIYDQYEIACPFLQEYMMIPEKELITIVSNKDERKNNAIATRPNLSFRISEALIEDAAVSAVLTLLYNPHARISDYAYQRLFERFENNEVVLKVLLKKDIPVYLLERIILSLSDTFKKQLLMQPDLPLQLSNEIVSQVRESALFSLEQSSTEEDVRTLITHLSSMAYLSDNLILRAACIGDMKFFEYAMSVKTGLPVRNTRILIYDSDQMGLDRLFEEAHLSKKFCLPISLAVTTYQELMAETEYGYRDHFCKRLIERLLILFEIKHIQLDTSDMTYLLRKIGSNNSNEAIN